MAEQQEFLTTRQIGDRLQLSQRTVQLWVSRGELPAYRFGSKLRIKATDLESFLEKSKRVHPVLWTLRQACDVYSCSQISLFCSFR